MNLNKLQTYTKKKRKSVLIKKPKWSDSKIVNNIYFILFFFGKNKNKKNLSLNKRNINT